jgi:hypothetical protein
MGDETFAKRTIYLGCILDEHFMSLVPCATSAVARGVVNVDEFKESEQSATVMYRALFNYENSASRSRDLGLCRNDWVRLKEGGWANDTIVGVGMDVMLFSAARRGSLGGLHVASSFWLPQFVKNGFNKGTQRSWCLTFAALN